MLHPSYTDLMKVVNSGVEEGDTPVVNSRYSIVMATAKRARQIIAGETNVPPEKAAKPLSTAVEELNTGKIKILPQDDDLEERIEEERTRLAGTADVQIDSWDASDDLSDDEKDLDSYRDDDHWDSTDEDLE